MKVLTSEAFYLDTLIQNGFRDYSWYSKAGHRVCYAQLVEWFDIPDDCDKLWFEFHNRQVAQSVRFELAANGYHCFLGKNLSLYALPSSVGDRLRKTLKPRKTYYIRILMEG